MLRYYNGIMGSVIDVDVNDIIEREVRRSYWREKKQRERYYMRVVPLEDGFGFDGCECDFIDEIIYSSAIKFYLHFGEVLEYALFDSLKAYSLICK